MRLKDNGITTLDGWFEKFPPMGGSTQWKDGRSAKELARYMLGTYPRVPSEIEEALSVWLEPNAELAWSAEYVTDLCAFGLGRGEGRNHDAILFHPNMVVGIEGKADESLGSQRIGDAWNTAGENKKQRIRGMIQMLFGDAPERHPSIRYQLVSASVATLLEAVRTNAARAMLLIIVFKKEGCYSEKKTADNLADIQAFLSEIQARREGAHYVLPTAYGREHSIELCFQYIEIKV